MSHILCGLAAFNAIAWCFALRALPKHEDFLWTRRVLIVIVIGLSMAAAVVAF